MVIINLTNKKMITDSAVSADSYSQMLFGLILEKIPKTMVFRTHFGIHTFFMKYAIDVMVLNRNNKVVCLKKKLKPNRIYFWNPKYSKIIELPEGTIDKASIQYGDHIKIKI